MEEKATFDAYLAIHHFFDCFVFDSVSHKIDTIIHAAIGNKIWNRQMPGDLVYYMIKLESLIEAVFVIHDHLSVREEVITGAKENEPPDVSKTEMYFKGSFSSSEWNNFPRNLSARQYHDPYKALEKFCSYMPQAEWKETLESLSIYALCNDSVLEVLPPGNILTLRRRLLQLMEASHLINVRIHNKEKTGEKKKKGAAKKQHQKIFAQKKIKA